MSSVTMTLMAGVLGVTGAWVSGCDGGAEGAEPVGVSLGQLLAAVTEAPTRIEVTLGADGAVSELRASPELGHDEHLQGVVVAADREARVIELADIGVVTWTAGARLRTRDESHASEDAWWAALEAGADGPIVVRASRASASVPDVDRFVATDLRVQSGDDVRARLELWVPVDAVDATGGMLTLFGRAHDLTGARLYSEHGGESGADGTGVEVED